MGSMRVVFGFTKQALSLDCVRFSEDQIKNYGFRLDSDLGSFIFDLVRIRNRFRIKIIDMRHMRISGIYLTLRFR